jgi:hypothetical protein
MMLLVSQRNTIVRESGTARELCLVFDVDGFHFTHSRRPSASNLYTTCVRSSLETITRPNS